MNTPMAIFKDKKQALETGLIRKLKYHLLVLLATILVAGAFLASEKLAGIINPISLTLLRFAGASLILLPIVLARSKWRTKILSALPRALVISLFYSVFYIAFFEALKTTTSINTGALFTLVPFITALLSILAFKEGISKRQVVVYFFGAAGACWVVFGGKLELLLSFSINNGDLIFMVGVLSMCCYSIVMKFLYRNDEMIVLVFCTMIGGSFWMVLALLITGQSLQWEMIQGNSILHMAYLIIVATPIVYLYQKTTVILGPSRVTAYIYLTPGWVAILLFLINGVSIPIPIPMAIIPGILITSVATFILEKNSSQETKIISAKRTVG